MSAYIFQFVGTGLLATFNASTPSWAHYTFVVPAGIGFGGSITVLLIALISSLPPEGPVHINLTDDRSSNGHRDELSLP
jgi:hypothetical protein